jgi:NADPH:quinone reductase-like Zn-dependent oxidoreductase
MPTAYGFVDYGGPEMQRHLEVPLAVPSAGQLVVEVRAAGVNPVDWKVRNGAQRAFHSLRLPSVFGREVSGEVVALGAGVTGFAVGDAVFGCTTGSCGGFSQYALVDANQLARKPEALSFIDAAVLPVAAATAQTSVREIGLGSGQTLLVLGISGGVGIAVAQLARAAGITVIGTARTAKRDGVESLGATVVPYDRPDLMARLKAATPNGVDAVLDLAGGDALDMIGPLLAGELVDEGRRVLSVARPDVMAKYGARRVFRDPSAGILTALGRLTAAGKFDPHVRHVFSLDDAARALDAVERCHVFGKVVVTVSAAAG